jgi:hypothetical protein
MTRRGPAQAIRGRATLSQRLAGLLLQSIQAWSKEHQLRQCCPQMPCQFDHVVFYTGRSPLAELIEQGKPRFQLTLPHLAGQDPLLSCRGQHHDFQQPAQFG